MEFIHEHACEVARTMIGLYFIGVLSLDTFRERIILTKFCLAHIIYRNELNAQTFIKTNIKDFLESFMKYEDV